MLDLLGAADDLYGLEPERFVAARSEHQRAAADRGNRALADQIGALRKPTTAAWAVNLLVRLRRDDVQRLLDLAERMRAPDEDLGPAQLRETNRLAQLLVQALTRAAGELASDRGHPLSSALADRVRATIRRAMADPTAAGAMLSGRLVTTLEAGAVTGLEAGAGSPDVAAALAVPASVTSLAVRSRSRGDAGGTRHAQRLALARRESDEALRDATAAAEIAAAARHDADRMRDRRDALAADTRRSRQLLVDQERQLAELNHLVAEASRNLRSLGEAAHTAAARADRAAARLRSLLDPDG